MSLPSSITASTNYDEASDDPKQARAQLAGLRADVHAINEHLKLSPLLAPATPLALGEGLESASGALRVKLDGNAGLARSANGLALDVGALTALTTPADADLVAVYDSSIAAMRKVSRANFLAGAGLPAASLAEAEAASAGDRALTPAVAHRHPGSAKAWVHFNGTGTPAAAVAYNVDSIVDNGVGSYGIVLADDFSSADYVGVGMADQSASLSIVNMQSIAAGTFGIRVQHFEGAAVDVDSLMAVFFGDQ
jgi:hypothetical protein